MWIAKPIQALTTQEYEAWCKVEDRLPFSQTYDWARGIAAVSGQAYFVFSPNEEVGGMVFSTPLSDGGLHFECINGPHLNWDRPDLVPRQLATFATAVSRLDRSFKSLSLKPRWIEGQMEKRLMHLPLPLFRQTQAATLVIPILESDKTQFETFSPRLRRTLQRAWRSEVSTSWQKVTLPLLENFVLKMAQFGSQRGFVVPPLAWFEGLILHKNKSLRQTSATFWIASSSIRETEALTSFTRILVSVIRNQAYYLFGYEDRTPQMRSALSTSAPVHWETLLQCRNLGVKNYDLNGYVVAAKQNNPYYGVCRFKEQFAGQIVKYDVPEFMIQ